MTVEPRNFVFNSRYPIDKVAGSQTGSVSVSASSFGSDTIPHGLSYRPLYLLKWSTNSGFSVSYDEIGTSTSNEVLFNASTDSTDLSIFYFNSSASTVTIYYRVVYFMPPDVDEDAAPTADSLDKFAFNTQFNYTKILLDAKTASNTATISHDLGYYPQVEAWYITPAGDCVHVVEGEVNGSPSSPYCRVSTTQITLGDPGSAVDYWYYKVYVDET